MKSGPGGLLTFKKHIEFLLASSCVPLVHRQRNFFSAKKKKKTLEIIFYFEILNVLKLFNGLSLPFSRSFINNCNNDRFLYSVLNQGG